MASERERVIPAPRVGWERAAVCRATDPGFFFSEERGPYGNLGWQRYCPKCPVRADCLAHSLRNDEKWGVWGGFTPVARKRLLAQLLEGTVVWRQVKVTLRR